MTKITFIGGGGRVSTTAAAHIAKYHESKDLDLVLYDTDYQAAEDSLRIVKRGAEFEGTTPNVQTVRTIEAALQDSDFILYCAQNPGSGKPPYNLNQTLGNIDAMLDLIRQARTLAKPDFRIINYANPTDFLGMIVAAQMPEVEMITLCTGGEEFKQNMLRVLGVPAAEEDRLFIQQVGGNHYGFITQLELDGKDVLPQLKNMNFEWRKMKGLRHGDNYDVARILSLFRASNLLTIPSGHVAYFHGVADNPGHGPDHGHFRPLKSDMVERCLSDDISREYYWDLMDSWATRGVALTVMAYLGLEKGKRLPLQMPNNGFIDGLDDRAFVESWGTIENGTFTRFKADIPPLIKHLVIHNNWANFLMAQAFAEKNYEKLVQSMMLRGDRTNFRFSIPSMRMIIKDKWHLDDDLEDIYSRDIFDKHPDLEFEYMEFEEKVLLHPSDQ